MKMNHHYGELKASYLFVDIAHKVAAYQEAHPEKCDPASGQVRRHRHAGRRR